MTDRTCWTCGLNKIGGHLTFLGICSWFVQKGQAVKPIPPAVVDVGCKFWTLRIKRAAVEEIEADHE